MDRLEGKKLSVWARLKRLAFTDVNAIIRGLNASDLATMERTLIEADFGVPATVDLTTALEDPAYQRPDAFTGAPGNSWFNHWEITAGRSPVPTPGPPTWVTAR